MPWQVPITVDGLEYPVTFNTEGEPTQQDYDEAVQQILSQKAQSAPEPKPETPGYLSQLGSALGLGYRQMKSGVGATFNALTGDTADVAAEMAEMSKLQREQQAAQTPEDVEFMRSLEEAEKGFEQAQGPLESIGALTQYPAAVFAQPGAAFKTAVQSAPNALISGATSLAGYGLGGLLGGAATLETGPGAILGGLAGAAAGGALSNTLMEAGPSIFDVLNERTQGAASNMTADEIAAYLQQNPDIVDEGLKTGAIRGSVIGAVEALGVKGSGRLLTMPERAAARAVQKELMAQGVDVASKEAVDKALLDPALRASTKAAAETAKNQFSSAGNMARLAGASAIETGAAGAGELAAQAAAGQDISTKEAFLEMMGDAALSLPMAATTKALEGAKYMLNPALVSDLGKASAENLAAAGSSASAEAQEAFNEAIELTMLPFTREDIRATEMPFTREDIRATDLPFTREDIRATQLPFGREDIRATEMPFSREDIRGISTPTPAVEEEPQTPSPEMEMPSPPQGVDMALAPLSPIINEAPLSEGAERNHAIIAEAAAVTTVQAAPIAPENLQSALDEHTSGPKTPEQDWQFAVSMPEGIWIEDGQGGRMRKKIHRIKKSGAEEIEFEHQIFNEDTGEWEKNPSANAYLSKKKDGSLAVNNRFPSSLRPFSYTESSTGERKTGRPVVVLPKQQPATTQENAAPEIPLEESVRQEPQDRAESREAEGPSSRDQLRSPAEGEVEEEVGLARYKEAISAGLDERTASGLGAAAEIGAMARELQNLTPDELRAERVRNFSGDLARNPQGTILGGNVRPTFFPDGGQEAILRQSKKGGYEVVAGGPIRPLSGEKSLPQVKKGKVLATYPSIESFVDAVYGVSQPITPPAKPTPTTEGMVTPGGVATERDLTKPEQMTPEEALRVLEERIGPNDPKHPDYSRPDWLEIESRVEEGENLDEVLIDFARGYLKIEQEREAEEAAAIEATRSSPDKEYVRAQAKMSPDQFDREVTLPELKRRNSDKKIAKDAEILKRLKAMRGDGDYFHAKSISEAIYARLPVNVEAVDTYGIKLPEGYVKQGDLYVFQPQTTKAAAETQTPESVGRGLGGSRGVQSEPSEGSIPEVAKVSTETETASTEKSPVTEAAIRDLEESISKLPEKAQAKWTPEVMAKARDFYDSADRNQSRLDGLTQIQKNKVYDSLYRADKAAAAEQDRIEKAQKARDKEIEKEEREAAKKEAEMLKREEMRSKAIDSIIGKGEKQKRKFGQVTNSDAIAAVAMLVSSKDIPGVLTTWWGTKGDFLRDPANQTADPEIYARIKAGELVEGFFNKGRAYVFLDGIGVSDEDMLRGEQMDVSPQVAAVRRVLLHESLVHRGIHGLPLRHRRLILNWVRQNSTPAELDDLAKLYTEYANWRNSDYQFEALAEEFLAKKVDSLTEIPKDGPMAKLMDILRQIWDFIVGYKREPTLSDLKSVLKLLKSGAEALTNDTLKDGGGVKLSAAPPSITNAYNAASVGQSSAFVPLSDVLAKSGMDEQEFTQEVMRLYDRGEVFLEGANSTQEAEQAPFSIKGTPVGTAVRIMVPQSFASYNPTTSAKDTEYLAAVEAGDMEKAQRMVNEAARAAGYDVGPVWHGTPNDWTIYDIQKSGATDNGYLGKGIYLGPSERWGEVYARGGNVLKLYASINNPLQVEAEFDGRREIDRNVTVKKSLGLAKSASSSEITKQALNMGYDGIQYSYKGEIETVVFNPNQIKSADPVTRDDAGNVIPLSQRFQPTSSDIRFSRPQFASDYTAAQSAGNEAARSTIYSERDMDIREAIRRAYEVMPKTNSVAVPIGELFAKTEELIPGVTQDEFSNVLQDLFEDNGAVLQEGESDFFVTTPEGRRAGFVVVMPRAAKASRIKAEDVAEASKSFQADLVEAGKGRLDTEKYKGFPLKGTALPEHPVKAYDLYRDGAIKLIDDLLAKTNDIVAVADSLQDPEFQVALGLQVGPEVSSDMITIARQLIGVELQNRLRNMAKKERNPVRKRQIELAEKSASAYYSASTGAGQSLQNIQQIQDDPRYKSFFLFEQAGKKKAETGKKKLDAITGGTEAITDIITGAEKKAVEETTQAEVEAQESAAEDDQDAIDLAAGEATLTEPEKSLYEEYKDILRRRGILDMLDKRDASAAKASISSEERNALTKLTKAERDEMRKRDDKRRMEILARLLGKESPTDTPSQKATRQKREKMVKTAQKRVEAGKDIDVQSRIESLFPLAETREEIINEVGDALLKAAEQRKVKPKQRTAIQDFVSAIKQTLMANIKGDKINAEQPSLGMLLAKTFAQQGSQPEEFAAAWANGRKKVRGMLAEMGVEDGNLDAELDAIMPPTPTLAYAPAAARKAVSNAMREAGLMRSDLLNDPAGSKKAIMEKFDEAAKSANLTEEGWDKKGRALAEKAVDESIAEAKMAQERAKKVAKILSEQADKPVSLEEFGTKLAEFRFKKDKIAELFNRAKKLAERKIQMANDQAIRVLLAAENELAKNAFFNAAEKPDTIVKAFREQVEEPMERDAFKKRMEKMLVTPEMADKLFDKAARERDNARWKKAQDLLEGPKALSNLLREMNKARPADSVPLERAMPWRKILSSKPKDVAEYRQRIFEAISGLPSFQNLTDEQKERLADLYAESWEARLQQVNDRVLREEFKKARDRDQISDDVEKKLQQSRNKILEIINLGGFNNDDLIKILGERYGISTEFTEEQKARIQELSEQLQNEDLNPARRNKLAMEFAVALAGATDASVAEILSNWWTSSVLFGPQTIFSIGAAFVNGAYSIVTVGTQRVLSKLAHLDTKGAIEESILILKGIADYLGAFKQAGRRAWSYLWTGNVDALGASANDILGDIKSLDDLRKFKRHKLLAENLAKDPKALRRYVGVYLRFINRLLTSLDAFNIMVTKAGTASLALRISGMDNANIIKAEKMLNLKSYKDQVIQEYFDNKAPTDLHGKALVDSYAEAEMYRAIDKLGGKMENADYFASESAMTMKPTGVGGAIYKAITGVTSGWEKSANEYLEKVKKDHVSKKDIESLTFLMLGYLRQFAAYNAAGLTGTKFVRYASNKFNQGISFLPVVGLLRRLEAKDDAIQGKEAFLETINRNQFIGMVTALIGVAIANAIGDEPDDEKRGTFWNGGWENLTPDQKKQMLAKGQKEYTIGFKLNGRWYAFNYQNWPLNQILAAIGSISDQIRFSPKQWSEKMFLSKLAAGTVSGIKSTLEIPALSGLSELAGNRLASKDPTEQAVDRFSRVVSGWAGGFVPRILKDLDYATQPELRKYKTLWERMASHVPIYRRYVGEEYYDILGQPIKRNVIPGSREFMMGPTEPEYKILGALNSRNIFLTPANAEYRMVGKGRNRRRLTQEEADAYSLETGKGYRQMLLRYGQRALQMPTERARAFLSDKADEVRDRALKKVYRR